MNIIFRCEFGSHCGLGHLMRILALSHAFGCRGYSQTLLTNSDTKAYLPLLQTGCFNIVPFAEFTPGLSFDPNEFVEAHKDSITVFDDYSVTYEQMRQYRSSGNRLVAIDDLADRSFDVDILINQNLSAKELYYSVNSDAKLLLGHDYCMLRHNFFSKNARTQNVWGGHLLVSFGGGSVVDRVWPVFEALSSIDLILHTCVKISIAVPECDQKWQQVVRWGEKLTNIHVDLIEACYDLSNVMRQCDFAVTAAGSTVFELSALGVPQLSLIIDDNQVPTGQWIDQSGIGMLIGDCRSFDKEKFISQFMKLFSDSMIRKAMSKRAISLIDGLGASRVVSRISESLICCHKNQATC